LNDNYVSASISEYITDLYIGWGRAKWIELIERLI
tara:strand:- start:244 stop:348 length:105 start_codon:yes stop_codon:yes gene_type:complete